MIVDEPKKKTYKTPWYVPVSQWPKANQLAQQDKHKKDDSKRFGGVVQQKLDEITKKREQEQLHILQGRDDALQKGKHGSNPKIKKLHRYL